MPKRVESTNSKEVHLLRLRKLELGIESEVATLGETPYTILAIAILTCLIKDSSYNYFAVENVLRFFPKGLYLESIIIKIIRHKLSNLLEVDYYSTYVRFINSKLV